MRRWAHLLLTGLLLVGMLCSCTKKQAGNRPDRRPRVDKALMLCLGAIRAQHRQADLHLARSHPAKAQGAVEQILGLECVKRSNPEIQEAVLDTYGRLARLHMQKGALDEAGRWLDKGLKRPGPPSFFRANLYMVQGDLLDARAIKLDKAGQSKEADVLRRKAITAFDRSSKMNRRLLEDLVK